MIRETINHVAIMLKYHLLDHREQPRGKGLIITLMLRVNFADVISESNLKKQTT